MLPSSYPSSQYHPLRLWQSVCCLLFENSKQIRAAGETAHTIFYLVMRDISAHALKFQQILGTGNAHTTPKSGILLTQSANETKRKMSSSTPMAEIMPMRARANAINPPTRQATPKSCDRCTRRDLRRKRRNLWRVTESSGTTSHILLTATAFSIIVCGTVILMFLTTASTIKRLDRTFGTVECFGNNAGIKPLRFRYEDPDCMEVLEEAKLGRANLTERCTNYCEVVLCDDDGNLVVPDPETVVRDQFPDSNDGPERKDDDETEKTDEELFNEFINSSDYHSLTTTPAPEKEPIMHINIIGRSGMLRGAPKVCTCAVEDGKRGACVCNNPAPTNNGSMMLITIEVNDKTLYRVNRIKEKYV